MLARCYEINSEMTTEEWRQIQDINVNGLLFLPASCTFDGEAGRRYY